MDGLAAGKGELRGWKERKDSNKKERRTNPVGGTRPKDPKVEKHD